MGHLYWILDCLLNLTQWIALNANAENITYFDSFGVEHIPKEIIKFIQNKNIKIQQIFIE